MTEHADESRQERVHCHPAAFGDERSFAWEDDPDVREAQRQYMAEMEWEASQEE